MYIFPKFLRFLSFSGLPILATQPQTVQGTSAKKARMASSFRCLGKKKRSFHWEISRIFLVKMVYCRRFMVVIWGFIWGLWLYKMVRIFRGFMVYIGFNWMIKFDEWDFSLDLYKSSAKVDLWKLHIYLVGGWATPLKNMKVNWDDEIPNIWLALLKQVSENNLWYPLII